MKALTNFTKNDLREIYEAYFDSLRGFLYYKTGDISLSEDLVQEVFIKLWAKRDTIDQATVKSLLYTMANNLMINHYNHQKVIGKHQGMISEEMNVDIKSPHYRLEEKEFEEKLNDALSALPEGCKEVFLMNRIDRLKYAEIAERLSLSVKAVEKRMSKALSILKGQLGIKI